jgi:hypothetical protein
MPGANHYSTNFSIVIITRRWQNRPISGRSAEWTQLDSTSQYTSKKKINRMPNDWLITNPNRETWAYAHQTDLGS